MFHYKKKQANMPNKAGKRLWHPVVVAQRNVVSTRTIARELSARSAATEGDLIGILYDLGLLLREHLSDGDRVVIQGIGSFKLSATASGEGVESEDKVSAAQFNKLRVIFTPESRSNRALGTKEVTLIAPERIKFVPIGKKGDNDGEESGNNAGGSSTPPSGGGSGFDGH